MQVKKPVFMFVMLSFIDQDESLIEIKIYFFLLTAKQQCRHMIIDIK